MSNYDASIRVSTKVDNRELKNLQEDFDDLSDRAEIAKKKVDALDEMGAPHASEAYRQATKDLEKYTAELAEIKEKLKGTSGEIPDEASEHFNYLKQNLKDVSNTLSELQKKGMFFGDLDYDKIYVAWKNATDAIKDYQRELNKDTESGMAKAEQQAAKEAEKQAAAQRRIEEQAERNLQKENARLEKEIRIEAAKRAEEAQQQRLNAIQRDAVVSNQNLLYLLRQQEAVTERMKLLRQAGVGEGYAEYDALSRALEQINVEIDRQRGGFRAADKAGRKLFDTVQKGSKKANSLLGKLGKRLVQVALAVVVFGQIRKAFSAMISSVKEGLGNLAKYSRDYNAAMSGLKSECATLKNSLAAAFEPIANTVIPYLTALVSWINTAANAFTQFTAALQGKSTYIKAKKQTIDYAKSLNTAADAAKGALAAFDEINVLEQDKSGTSSVGGELIGEDAFETVEIERNIQKIVDTFKEGFSFAFKVDPEQLKNNLDNIKQSLINVFEDPEVKEALYGLGNQTVKTAGATIGTGASIGTSVGIGVTKGIADALEELEEFNKGKVINISDNLTDTGKKAEDLAVAMGKIGTAFEDEKFSKIVSFLTKVTDVSILNGLELLTNILNDLFGLFTEPVAQNADKIREALENFFTVVDKLFAPLEKIFDLLFKDNQPDYEESFIAKLFDVATVNAVSMLGDGLDNLNTFLETLAFLLDLNSTAFGGFIEWIGQGIAAVAGFVNGIREGIMRILLKLYATYAEIRQIVGGITRIIGGIVKFITGVFSGDWEKAWGGLTEVVEGEKNVIKGILNGILGFIEHMVNGFIDGINDIAGGLSELASIKNPFSGEVIWSLNIKEIPKVSLPRLATGGITTRPTAALIGEAGREAVLPLERNTEWMDALANKINPNVTIRFSGSLSELGRILKPVIETENSRVGISYRVT